MITGRTTSVSRRSVLFSVVYKDEAQRLKERDGRMGEEMYSKGWEKSSSCDGQEMIRRE